VIARDGVENAREILKALELIFPNSTHERDRAIDKMLIALPYMRHAVKDAAGTGKVHIGILSVKEDGSGRVVAKFEAPEFFEDLALILDAPKQTEEDDLRASAVALLDNFGLRKP